MLYKNSINKFVEIHEASYPHALHLLKDPPAKIFYEGNLETLSDYKCLSIVGTRSCTSYGLDQCRNLVKKFYGKNLCIISGLARGIDSQAHKSALEYGLPTVAVLGEGIERVRRNPYQGKLLKEILNDKRSLVISEFESEFPADRWTYAHRNRIIAALSEICVVLESPKRGGSLITAGCALEMKKLLYSLTGDINKVSLEGNHYLLANKFAEPIFDLDLFYKSIFPEDFKDESRKEGAIFRSDSKVLETDQLSFISPNKEEIILKCIENQPLGLNEISQRTNIDLKTTMIEISKLELKLLVKRLAGSKFQKS